MDGKRLAFKNPPIWELSISVSAQAPGWFNPYDIRELHDLFRDQFPNVERHPAFVGHQIFPTQQTMIGVGVQQAFQMMPDLNRWWFVNELGSDIIQVQENFLARNWRRLVTPPAEVAPYPGFDAIYSDFQDMVGATRDFAGRHNVPFGEPMVCELVYEDLIPLAKADGGSWRYSELIAPIQFDPPIVAGGLTLSWLEYIDQSRRDGPFTLNVTIQSIGIPSATQEKPPGFVKISFIARSPCAGWTEAYSFIEAAHLRLGQRLVDLTTDAARAIWEER